MNTHTNDSRSQFRRFLSKELSDRIERNSNYSLRSFASFLEMSPGLLSNILRGNRKITDRSFEKISSKLKLSEEQRAMFLHSENQVDDLRRSDLVFDEQQFELLSNPIYFTVLELSLVKSFRNEKAWISERLGITELEVEDAIQCLTNTGHLKITANGKWQILSPYTSWTNLDKTSVARKEYQKQVLETAIEKIDDVAFSERENSSLLVAVDTALMPEIKKRIFNFKKELQNYIEDQGNFKEVYQFAVSFYPLSKSKTKKEEESV
ncbi:MAG: DUF4423 domain-containing protein [Bdellovibrionota bacterium]|nr:DUF4423 domain-containing protein [Bdellovibrionota bacterium]